MNARSPLPNRATSPEWQLLLACAAPRPDSSLLRERLCAPLEWPSVLWLAEVHGLVPLLCRRLGENVEEHISAEFRQRLRELGRAHLLSTLALTAELFRLTDRFDAAGIDAVVVKGPALAVQAFGDPGLRQYADLDLLVRHRDVLRAVELMRDAGLVTELSLEAATAGRVPGQFLFHRGETNAIVELHSERTLRYFPRPLPLDSLLARRVRLVFDGRALAVITPEDTLSVVCVHGAKHLWERLMWIADVAGLVTRSAAFDWSRAFSTARETGAERMVHLGLCLAMDALHADLPEEVSRIVRADRMAGRLAADVLRHLPAGEDAERGLIDRALFRANMRGGFLRGTAYLLRLSLAPTEEDWRNSAAGKSSRWIEVLRRPFRLARKYHWSERHATAPEAATAQQRKKARA